ncbi:MAG: tetratricopeptide repeat protein, partial [Myxococcota bacterium]
MRKQDQRHIARAWSRRTVAVVLGLVVSVLATSAAAQQNGSFRENARSLQKQVQNLDDRYLKPALVETRYRMESRFNDGKVAYMLEDYSRASILLVDIVEDPRGSSFDSYREAVFLLGDSLYQQRNFLAARKYFSELAEMGPGKHYQDAVVKLLEIAAKTRQYDEVEDLYGSLGSSAALSPAVNYMRGKTLFQQERYADARSFFQKASSDAQYDFVAPYFRGVAFAADKQFANAREVFNGIVEREPETEEDQHIVHLAYLGLGRVAYE